MKIGTICFIVLLLAFRVNSQPPAPIFAGNDTTICEGDLITLTADNPWGVPISWNNGVTNGVPFSPNSTTDYIVTANNAGTYSYDTITVTVESVIIGFSSDFTVGCPPLSITLTDWSNLTNCLWTLNNGTTTLTGNNCTESFVLSEPGVYSVTLQAQNTSGIGCTGTETYYDYIFIDSLPDANFTLDAIGCNPVEVTFNNTSSYTSICLWNINNTTSGFSQPSSTMWGPFTFSYYDPGFYDVELIVYTNIGCSDTSILENAFSVGCNELIEVGNPNKTVLKIIDLTGRQTEFKPNTPLIYIYSDGSTERVMKLEE